MTGGGREQTWLKRKELKQQHQGPSWRVWLLNHFQKGEKRKEHPAKGNKRLPLWETKGPEWEAPSWSWEHQEKQSRTGSLRLTCPPQAARCKGRLYQRLNMRLRRDWHDNGLVGSIRKTKPCLKPALLVGLALWLL